MSRTEPPGRPGQDGRAPTDHEFTAPLWLRSARRGDSWTFVTVPEAISAAIEDEAEARGPRAGFGSVKVSVLIGTTAWETSVFPDSTSGCFVLPIKAAVRRANDLEAGDSVTIRLHVR